MFPSQTFGTIVVPVSFCLFQPDTMLSTLALICALCVALVMPEKIIPGVCHLVCIGVPFVGTLCSVLMDVIMQLSVSVCYVISSTLRATIPGTVVLWEDFADALMQLSMGYVINFMLPILLVLFWAILVVCIVRYDQAKLQRTKENKKKEVLGNIKDRADNANSEITKLELDNEQDRAEWVELQSDYDEHMAEWERASNKREEYMQRFPCPDDYAAGHRVIIGECLLILSERARILNLKALYNVERQELLESSIERNESTIRILKTVLDCCNMSTVVFENAATLEQLDNWGYAFLSVDNENATQSQLAASAQEDSSRMSLELDGKVADLMLAEDVQSRRVTRFEQTLASQQSDAFRLQFSDMLA